MNYNRHFNAVILALLLYFHSCCSYAPREAPTSRVYPGQTTNPIFLPYIDDFPGSTNVYIVLDNDLASKHKELGKAQANKTVGTCFHRWGGASEIGISTQFWNKASEARRKLLLWHELGHCSLDLRHDDSMSYVLIDVEKEFRALLKNSIMHSILWNKMTIIYNCEFNYNIDDLSDKYCISIANDGSLYELIDDE